MKKSIFILCCLLSGLNGLSGQNGQALIVEFTEMDSLQYIEFRKEYANTLIADSTKQTIPDSSFTLIINNEEQRFNCNKDYSGCYYYRGFLPPLNSFVLTHCGMYDCGTFMIDQGSGERQSILTPFEADCNTEILLSKDQNKILVFSSDVYERQSYISLYQRKNKRENFDFGSFKSLTTDKWKIDQAIWIDDKTFALITFDDIACRTKGRPMHFRYLKGEIKTIAGDK